MTGILFETLCTFTVIYRWSILELNMFRTKVVQKIKTHILYSVSLPHPPKIVPVYEIMWKMLLSRADHSWQYNTARALCMLDT